MTTITLPLSHLLAANEFVSKDKTRYYLNGVYLHARDNKIHAVATDGHRLIDIPSIEYSGDMAVIVPSDAIKKLKAVKHIAEVKITIDALKLKIEYAGMTINCDAIDATYPDYMRVKPSGDVVAIPSIGFNAKYLGDFAKVNKLLGLSTHIKFEFFGTGSPCRITTDLYDAVLMPVRI